jgi:16S rRNA processing protein RimM
LRVGRLTKAHGLKGAIKVELSLELIELKWYNSHAVAFFKDVPDRSVAESLLKAILWIDHDDSDSTEEEDAWFDHQLVGLTVLRDSVPVGTVSQIDHFPAQDLLTVATSHGLVLVPFVKAIVTVVDVKAGTLTVNPPLGLFEAIADDADERGGPHEAPHIE